MKLLSTPVYRAVTYFGVTIAFPFWVRFIATDADGTVKIFSEHPTRHREDDPWLSCEVWFQNHGMSESIATVDLEGMDWRETLVEV